MTIGQILVYSIPAGAAAVVLWMVIFQFLIERRAKKLHDCNPPASEE